MKTLSILVLLAGLPFICLAQSKKLHVNGHTFLLREYRVKSEEEGPGKHDVLLKLYRTGTGKPEYVYQHYLYKNEGGDCNNLFWDIGSYQVSGDTIRFITHHCQKTGLDPIPEWEQRTYTINHQGGLVLIGDQYREKGSTSWKSD